jgi:hypothetical protein
MIMLNFTDEVDLLLNGDEPSWDEETDRQLRAHPVDVVETEVTGVENDGSWDVDLDTRAVLTVPDEYRIAAVADPGPDALDSTARIDESTLRGFDTVATTTVRTTDPSPSASVSQPRIATGVGDEVRVDGRAPGPGETIRAYVVSPRGAVDASDMAVGNDDAFDLEYDDFDESGRYRVLVVTAGRDGVFAFADGGGAAAIGSELTGRETSDEAETIVRDAYGGAGVDDRIVGLNITATDPTVRLETVRRRNDTFALSGTSNRENGTTVAVDLFVPDSGSVVAVADTDVNASGRFRTTVDVSGLGSGQYALRAETADATDVRAVRLGGGSTATDDLTARPPTDVAVTVTTSTASDAAAAGESRTATERGARTDATGVGVGPVAAVVAVALSAFLAAMRRRR